LIAHGAFDDGHEELVELRRMDDGEGNAGGPDQAVLQRLAAKVMAVFQPLRAHDRQRHVVPYACRELGFQQVPYGGTEEMERRLVVEGR